MSVKTKNINTFDNLATGFSSAAQNLGLIMMATATTLGLVETGEHQNAKATLNLQPIFAVQDSGEEHINPLRREREESGPHYTSYGVSQRIPGRTGKQ